MEIRANRAEEIDGLRYPVGRFQRVDRPGPEALAAWVEEIAMLPSRLRTAVDGLDAARLDTPYREGGWTVRQVVHHLPDSHMNGYIRMSLALAEEGRNAAPYDEAKWAAQPFARTGAIESSLLLLDGLHMRWAATARGLDEAELRRTLQWPDRGLFQVGDLLNLYAWHSRHHTAQIMTLRERRGW